MRLMPDPVPPPMAAPNVTVTSSEPIATTVRSGLQLLTGGFIVEGIEAFGLYDFTERQSTWATAAFTLALVLVQNLIEKQRNRKFLGAAPQPATLDDGYGRYDVLIVLGAVVLALLAILLLRVLVGA